MKFLSCLRELIIEYQWKTVTEVNKNKQMFSGYDVKTATKQISKKTFNEYKYWCIFLVEPDA